MKVILDTNVLVSGIFFKGPPYEILLHWKRESFILVVTHAILEEYKKIVDELAEKFMVNAEAIMETIALNAHVSFSITLPCQICDDPDDDKFFAAAIASKVRIIVSGDKHLLEKSGYSGIKVIKPAEFLHSYLGKK